MLKKFSKAVFSIWKPGLTRLSSRWRTLPLPPHPLTCRFSESTAKTPAVFQLTNKRTEETPAPPLALALPPLSSRYAYVSLSTLSLQSPVWLAGLFSLLFNKRNKKKAWPHSLYEEKEKRGECRTPFLKLQRPKSRNYLQARQKKESKKSFLAFLWSMQRNDQVTSATKSQKQKASVSFWVEFWISFQPKHAKWI